MSNRRFWLALASAFIPFLLDEYITARRRSREIAKIVAVVVAALGFALWLLAGLAWGRTAFVAGSILFWLFLFHDLILWAERQRHLP